MFGAIKPESPRVSKQQHLADFFSWGTKDGTWDDTGVRVPEVRYDRSAATLPPEIADDSTVFLDPRTRLP